MHCYFLWIHTFSSQTSKSEYIICMCYFCSANLTTYQCRRNIGKMCLQSKISLKEENGKILSISQRTICYSLLSDFIFLLKLKRTRRKPKKSQQSCLFPFITIISLDSWPFSNVWTIFISTCLMYIQMPIQTTTHIPTKFNMLQLIWKNVSIVAYFAKIHLCGKILSCDETDENKSKI